MKIHKTIHIRKTRKIFYNNKEQKRKYVGNNTHREKLSY